MACVCVYMKKRACEKREGVGQRHASMGAARTSFSDEPAHARTHARTRIHTHTHTHTGFIPARAWEEAIQMKLDRDIYCANLSFVSGNPPP